MVIVKTVVERVCHFKTQKFELKETACIGFEHREITPPFIYLLIRPYQCHFVGLRLRKLHARFHEMTSFSNLLFPSFAFFQVVLHYRVETE